MHAAVVLLAAACAAYAAFLPSGSASPAQVGPGAFEAATVRIEASEVVPAVSTPGLTSTSGPAPEAAPAAAPTIAVPPVQEAARALEDSQRINALGSAGASPDIPLCRPSSSPAYCIYTVREGDTLSDIAQLFSLGGGEISGWELLAASNKPDITSVDDYILPGQNLRVPTTHGIVHTTVLNETVGDLADVFDVSSAEIIRVNSLGSGNLINIGQVLLIPNPKRMAPPPAIDSGPAAAGSGTVAAAAAPPPRPLGFTWPLRTSIKVTNYMTARHPLGIDMGLSHDPTTLIHAVEDGVVSFAGGDRCCSYGLYVIVDHGNGLKTLYAHLSRIDVGQGQRVSQGQPLGQAGNTGYSFGVHLHFEVHLNGKRVNPMGYLP
jgi:murein DD-endopeptidase MepM/ murein hydrolase activator NlpD